MKLKKWWSYTPSVIVFSQKIFPGSYPYPHPKEVEKQYDSSLRYDASISQVIIWKFNPAEKKRKKNFGKDIKAFLRKMPCRPHYKRPLDRRATLVIIDLFVQPDCQYSVKLNNKIYYLDYLQSVLFSPFQSNNLHFLNCLSKCLPT